MTNKTNLNMKLSDEDKNYLKDLKGQMVYGKRCKSQVDAVRLLIAEHRRVAGRNDL